MDEALLERVQKQAWVHLYPRGAPILLFLLTAAITLLSVVALERAEAARRQMELQNRAAEAAAGLERVATEHLAILHAAAAVFSLRGQVTRQEFVAFGQGLRGTGAYHGAIGIGWAQMVAVDGIPRFEEEMRKTGFRGFRVIPDAAGKAVAVPIAYLVPETDLNRSALGFDLYADPVRRQAMDQAVRSEQPVISGRIPLFQGRQPPGSAGFLMLMPVYRQERARKVPKGFVFTPFRAQDFLAAATELNGDPDMEVRLYDGAMKEGHLLAEGPAHDHGGPSAQQEVTIANRKWTVSVGRREAVSLSDLSRASLIFGIVTSLLVLTVARLITKRAAEEREVLEWLTRQSAIRTSLTRELNHRVKNTLANVLSIVSLTRRRATDLDDFSDSLTGRLRALSATHDLLSQTDWRDVSIDQLIRTELAPYIDETENRIAISGPEVSLAPTEALSFGLAIHELATNAAKYGALSTAEGRIFIEWRLQSPQVAEVLWREEGGPPVTMPTKRGFGIDLLEKIVAQELNSRVDMQFLPTGVQCRLHVPVRKLSDFTLRTTRSD